MKKKQEIEIPKELYGLINLLAEMLADEFLTENQIKINGGKYDETDKRQ